MSSAEMPKISQGTWLVTDRGEWNNMVQADLEIGYRYIDTAELYGNDPHVGEALNTADVGREEVCVATKLTRDNLSHERVNESTSESLERIGSIHEWCLKRASSPLNPAWKWQTSV